jgi:hypothetical protein
VSRTGSGGKSAGDVHCRNAQDGENRDEEGEIHKTSCESEDLIESRSNNSEVDTEEAETY